MHDEIEDFMSFKFTDIARIPNIGHHGHDKGARPSVVTCDGSRAGVGVGVCVLFCWW